MPRLILLFAALASFFPVMRASIPAPEFLRPGATLVFIGDSITDGGRARTGNDYNHTMGQGYAFLLAADLGHRLAERNLTFINRGVSGERVLDLQKRWQADVLDLKPDVLSILVGINDTLWARGETVEQFESIYDQLLSETLAALPGVRIILGEPFVLPAGRYKDSYAATLAEVKKRQDVVARLAAKHDLPFVRYQSVYNEACLRAPAEQWSWDGVHPHYAGHALMADAWLRVAAKM